MSTQTTPPAHVEDAPRRIDGVAVGAVVAAVLALVVAIFALGRALAQPIGGAPTPLSTEQVGSGAAATVDVSLVDLDITPDVIEVAADGVLRVTNDGVVPHNLKIKDTEYATADLDGGDTAELSLAGLAGGVYEFWCDIPGHEAAGMVGTLTVVGDSSGAAAGGHDDMAVGWESMWETMQASIAAFPAETQGSGNEIMTPEIDAAGVKEYTLTIDEIEWEVEPGKFVEGIGYNGQIPGPMIKVDVGDTVRIRIVNQLDEITSWHPHGVRNHPFEADGVGFISQDPIKPGETWEAEFTVDTPSVGMYHGHDMGIHQVPNGAVGAFLVGDVDIPAEIEGSPVVDEVVMMLNDAGNIGYSLNGKSFPATAPYVLEQGQAMIVHYMHEGQMEHPMHLHGNRQLVIAKDGFPLDDPYWVDTLNISPGERYTVAVMADNVGTWVWHCHILGHVEKTDGTMFGMLTALVVTEPS